VADGTYERVKGKGPSVRAQEKFYLDAVEATRMAKTSTTRFRPLTRPAE